MHKAALLALTLPLFASLFAQAPPAAVNPLDKGYVLSFSDEFDGPRLDPSKWIDLYPDQWGRFHGNNEQQYYAPDGCEVKNGRLIIHAEKRTLPEAKGRPYTSGMIASQPHFVQKFGWWEIRTKLPKGKGLWPAFWLLPATKTWPPEIDIMEFLGHEPTKVHMTFHRRKPGERSLTSDTHAFSGPDFSADFHTFAVEWKADALVWYVDGVERARYTGDGIPAVEMYVLVNLAVGGDWPGMPDATTPFPSVMEVDYVRVYRKNE